MKKLIFAFVFCCLAGAGYAQEFTVRNVPGLEDWRVYTNKKFEQQLDSLTYKDRVRRAGDLTLRSPGKSETYMQQLTERLLTPQMLRILKQLKEEYGHQDKFMTMLVFFDKTGKIVTSQFVIPKEFLDTFTEKQMKELYQRAQKEVIDLTIFRFDNRAEFCYIYLSLPGPATKGKP